jgi:heme-degrading monooxygenase HmoA
MTIFKLPWRWRRRPDSGRVLVFASRFDGRGFRASCALFTGGVRIWRSAVRSPGVYGASLWAKPFRGKYYTLSAWESEEALRGFARGAVHRSGVKALYAAGSVDGVLISWWEDADGWRPHWKDAIRRADASTPGPYAGPAAEADTTAA